jgi:hypothetical protein
MCGNPSGESGQATVVICFDNWLREKLKSVSKISPQSDIGCDRLGSIGGFPPDRTSACACGRPRAPIAPIAVLVLSMTFTQCVWPQEPGTVSVNYAVTSQWATGFSAELTIRNNASRVIPDWRLSFQLSPQITGIWNARIVSRTDVQYLIGPASWDNGELESGRSVTIGFVATGSAMAFPTNGYLNGDPIRFNELSPAPRPKPLNVVPAPSWPREAFAPYVDATTWPQLDLLAIAQELKIRRFRLGFVVAHSASQPTPSWGSVHSATSSYRLREINALRALGGDVAIAFGGAVGIELAASTNSAAELAAKYKSVVDAYDARVLDFDLEGAWLADWESIQRRAEALFTLQRSMATERRPLEIWFTLPLLPTGLSGDGLHVIRSAIDRGVEIRGVNGMAMDYGGAAAPQPVGRMGIYAVEAARNLYGQLRALYAASGTPKDPSEVWQMIGITPMIGVNDVVAEVFQQSDADQLLHFAMKSRIGSLSIWSLNRDRACERPQALASPLCSGIPQREYEFTRIFKPFGASPE